MNVNSLLKNIYTNCESFRLFYLDNNSKSCYLGISKDHIYFVVDIIKLEFKIIGFNEKSVVKEQLIGMCYII